MLSPVVERAARFRLLARAGRLLAAALGRWRLSVGDAPRPVKPLAAARTGAAVVDVRGPTRVWMNPGRRPFDITVLLSDERAYRARAELAVRPDPGRLIVQLPPAGVEETARRLEGYAAAWGFPRATIADWRRGAERRPAGDRDHSTHVFTAGDVGGVHLEFEVAHHVREGVFTLAAHFSA
jgi:hypothetical protein